MNGYVASNSPKSESVAQAMKTAIGAFKSFCHHT